MCLDGMPENCGIYITMIPATSSPNLTLYYTTNERIPSGPIYFSFKKNQL